MKPGDRVRFTNDWTYRGTIVKMSHEGDKAVVCWSQGKHDVVSVSDLTLIASYGGHAHANNVSQ